jgi:tRNA pseudouridine55 synthase
MELLRFERPFAVIEVECGRGFYMRSLAHDLGAALGCGGHLAALTRTRCGPFVLEDSIQFEAIQQTGAPSGAVSWLDCVLAPDRAVEHLPAAILGEEHSTQTRHGRPLNLQSPENKESSPRCRAYSSSGDFLAVLDRVSEGQWKPSKVLDSLEKIQR